MTNVYEAGPRDLMGRRFFRGLWLRITATVALLAGGLVWVILYLAFLASRFAWYQNLAILLSTLIVVPTIVVLVWLFWALGVGRRMSRWVDGPF